MTRRVMVLAVVAVVAVVVLASCGIPASTGVRIDGPGPVGEAGLIRRGPEAPKRASAGSDVKGFAENFLAAAAGEPDQAYERVRDYIVEADKGQLPRKSGSEVTINVIRLKAPINPTANGNGTSTVVLDVQHVGVLRANGALDPPVATDKTYQFDVGAGPDGDPESTGLYVQNPPKVLLLDVNALRDYYLTRTLYFWNSEQTALIPDQRYLPATVPAQRRATEVVKWLIGGPAEWLTPTVARLPDRTELIGTVPEAKGRMEINLSTPAQNEDQIDRLATQLVWSLQQDLLDGELDLKIRNQSRKDIDDIRQYRRTHPVYPLDEEPQRFCVYANALHPLATSGQPDPLVPITAAVNRRVNTGAFRRADDQVLVALVITTGKRYQLVTGAGMAPVNDLTVSLTSNAQIGRPVWVKSDDHSRAVGLVVTDGRLYQFGTDAQSSQVSVNPSGRITAVSVSLDGHRIALIINGRLYVAALDLDVQNVTVGPLRMLSTSLTALTAVDWSGENTLVIAGSARQPALYEIGVDGYLETPLKTDVGDAVISHLAAYPDNPVIPARQERVMYETNGVAWTHQRSDFAPISPQQVLGLPVAPDGQSGNPTAPFYLY